MQGQNKTYNLLCYESKLAGLPKLKIRVTKIKSEGDRYRLLAFIRKLLEFPMYKEYISWKDKEQGIFKINDPEGLADLWGRERCHANMNYDKLSRALRYYYSLNLLRKPTFDRTGGRHCYQFVKTEMVSNFKQTYSYALGSLIDEKYAVTKKEWE